MTEELNVWGFTSQEEIQKTNESNWKWGVNHNVFLKEIEYHPATTNEEGKQVNSKLKMTFGFKDDDNNKNLILFEPEEGRSYNKSLKKWVKEGEEGYDEKKAKQMYKIQAENVAKTISNILSCYLDENKISTAISAVQQNCKSAKKEFGFNEFASLAIKGINSVKFQEIPLDIMLQYSSKLSSNGNSYLEIADASIGLFACNHIEGEWEEEKVPLNHYILFKLENGVRTNTKHPISRGKNEYFWKTNAEKVTIKNVKKEVSFLDTNLSSNTTPASSSDDIDWDNL